MSIFSDPEHIQRSAHGGLYPEAFGKFLTGAESAIDFAAGDNDYWETAERNGQKYVRVDADYARVPPLGTGEYLIADCRQRLPGVPDESYDVSLSSFFLQHLPARDIKAVLREMLRVTKTADDPQDASKGNILLFPAYRPQRLAPIKQHYPAAVFSGYPTPLQEVDFRPHEYETLILRKTEETKDKLPEVIERIAESGVLRKAALPRVATGVGKLLIAGGLSGRLKKY